MKTLATAVPVFCAITGMMSLLCTSNTSVARPMILFSKCVTERRTLITLDRDFGHVLRFPPQQSAGIVILELGGSASQQRLSDRLRDFLAIAASRSVVGELWIVEPGRVRVRLHKDAE
jgi:hypothetical protein